MGDMPRRDADLKVSLCDGVECPVPDGVVLVRDGLGHFFEAGGGGLQDAHPVVAERGHGLLHKKT